MNELVERAGSSDRVIVDWHRVGFAGLDSVADVVGRGATTGGAYSRDVDRRVADVAEVEVARCSAFVFADGSEVDGCSLPAKLGDSRQR